MPKINSKNVSVTIGTTYPAPLDTPCKLRVSRRLSNAGNLTQLGANHVTLPPDCWASQRHHHSVEDEFIYILTGHPTLIDDDGETPLKPGDSCAHPAGDNNAHHLVNNSGKDVTFLVVGTRNPEQDHCQYPDVDLDLPPNGTFIPQQFHKDGSPY